MRLSLAAREAPDGPALILGGEAYTFAELAALAREPRATAGLEAAEPGRPVPLVCHLRLDAILALYAHLDAGVPVALLSPRLAAAERKGHLAAIEAMRTATGPGERRALAVVFTSGSSGRPKGVELSVAAFRASARASAANLGWRPDDRWLLALPFAHIGGLSVLTRCLLARRAVVVPDAAADGFSPEAVIVAIARARVTLASLVPTQLAKLLDKSPRWTPPAHLRAVLVGGAAAAPDLLARAKDRGVPVLATYGLTEGASQLATERPGPRSPGNAGCGPPLPGVELRIAHGHAPGPAAQGRIEVRSPTLFTAYQPRAGAAPPLSPDGWFATGDVGRLDAHGRLHVLGREDDLLATGGEKVAPAEVERALLACQGVAAACVFGHPDPTWGAVVAAAVVARPGERISLDELRATLARRLGPAKRPRLLALLPALPTGRNGKTDRNAVARESAPLLTPLRWP